MIGNSHKGPRTGLGVLILAGTALLFYGTSRVTLVAAQTVSPVASPKVSPTADRLLEPTLPATPGAADLGAQVFWLYCMPCHGDRGQGLTAEFRMLYPETEQNCWASGCHGERPYEGGFTLPALVPAVIGGEVDQRFPTTAALDVFIRAAMPRQAPGSLSSEQYKQIIAFLARENNLPLVLPSPAAAIETATGPPPTLVHAPVENEPSDAPGLGPALAVTGATALVGLFLLLRRRRPRVQ